MAARLTPGKGPKSDKSWRDALERAVRRPCPSGGQWLEKIADAVVKAASEADMQAVKEIGDRLDGRPMTPVSMIINPDPEARADSELIDAIVAHARNLPRGEGLSQKTKGSLKPH